MRNPFTPSAGAQPPELAGRERERGAFDLLIRRLAIGNHENSLILYGLRGVGKTVLVRPEFKSIAGLHGWSVVDMEVRTGSDVPKELARELARELRRFEPGKALVKRALQVVKSFEATWSERGWSLGVSAEALAGFADSGSLESDIADLFVAAGEAAQDAGSGIAVLIDEMQLMPREPLEAIVAGIHEIAQRRLPLCMAGAGLPQLPGIIAEAKTYAERLFTYLEVGGLRPEAAGAAIRLPVEKAGSSIDDEAVVAVLELSSEASNPTNGAYPYFLQVYGKHVWDVARGSSITIDDVDAIRPTVRDSLDEGFFHVRWEKATQRAPPRP